MTDDPMDPLSLTVSILTIVGATAQCIKLLKSAASLKSPLRLVLDLDDELSNLRRDVFAIQDLFLRQSKGLMSYSNPVTPGHDTTASVIDCLEQANALVIELDCLLNSLLVSFLRSDIIGLKKRIGWLRKEKRMKDIKQGLFNIRIRLNTALGILDWLDFFFSVIGACHQSFLIGAHVLMLIWW